MVFPGKPVGTQLAPVVLLCRNRLAPNGGGADQLHCKWYPLKRNCRTYSFQSRTNWASPADITGLVPRNVYALRTTAMLNAIFGINPSIWKLDGNLGKCFKYEATKLEISNCTSLENNSFGQSAICLQHLQL